MWIQVLLVPALIGHQGWGRRGPCTFSAVYSDSRLGQILTSTIHQVIDRQFYFLPSNPTTSTLAHHIALTSISSPSRDSTSPSPVWREVFISPTVRPLPLNLKDFSAVPSTMASGDYRSRAEHQTASFVAAKLNIRELRVALRQFQDGSTSSEARDEAVGKTTRAVQNSVDAYEARLADLQELVADTKQELVKVDSQHSKPTDLQRPSFRSMDLYAAWQDELAAQARDSLMPVPKALVEWLEEVFSVQEAREAQAIGKEVSPHMGLLLQCESLAVRRSTRPLEYYIHMLPHHIQACASGPRAGLTVSGIPGSWVKEALGTLPLTDSDKELLRWELRKRPLTEQPTTWPDCSLSLSTKLMARLTSCIQEAFRPHDSHHLESDPDYVLSIGSGSGLLEAHLQSWWSTRGLNVQIHGVEVRGADYTTPNRYLLWNNRSTVRGTWELSSTRLHLAHVLVFVYPRQVDLVKKYLDEAARGKNGHRSVRGVIWLGPRNDWDPQDGHGNGEGQQDRPMTFKRCFEEAEGFERLSVVNHSGFMGLRQYEMMAFVRRKL